MMLIFGPSGNVGAELVEVLFDQLSAIPAL